MSFVLRFQFLGVYPIPFRTRDAYDDVSCSGSRGNIWREFRTTWRREGKFRFRDQFPEMEVWDEPEQDDFESRYADELEMLDDFEEKGENLPTLVFCGMFQS